jgi:NAD-dependent deacetylase
MPKKIVILTGAGISAESGIKTFRDANGLWENHRIEDVASPEGFARDPETVYRFYNMRRQQLVSDAVAPNAAHIALAKLQKDYDGDVILVTQNIDDLHERGGAEHVMHMHGELLKARCNSCGQTHLTRLDFDADTVCEHCDASGYLRPDIVWFGEMPFFIEDIMRHLYEADIFAAIGTSGQIYPAAGFVDIANQTGAMTLEFNLEQTSPRSVFDDGFYGPAGETVPNWVDDILDR